VSGTAGSAVPPGDLAGLPPGFEATGPPLGVGATAVVWPARRVLDGREFALKVWRRPFTDEAERERFRREVRQQATLNDVSGHIVTYSWAEEDPAEGTPWIGTQQHGESLEQVLERGRPPLGEGLALCADLLAGLGAMHGLGALHRDVKPGNVLVHDGRAKLCDLGLVMDSAAHTSDNAAGSPRYVAPELLDGTTRPSFRTDVYSAAQSIRQILGGGLPEPLEQLVTEAASVDPNDRPADARSFERRFRQAGEVLGYRLPVPLPARAGSERDGTSHLDGAGQQRGRARRVLVPIGAAALALLAVAGAAFFFDRPGERSGGSSDSAPGPETSVTASASRETPDAGLAPPDIAADGKPVLLPQARAGRCPTVVKDAEPTARVPLEYDGGVVAEVHSYYSRLERQACAKLVKPNGSRYAGMKTHLALTLCGDANSCDHDWHAYAIDAGPVVVPSRNGCVSWRVSMLDDTGTRWIVRDSVQSFGCS